MNFILDNTQSERKGANHLNVELDVSGGSMRFLHLKAWNIFDFWLGTWTYEKGIKLIIVECLKELVWDENLKYLKFFERAFAHMRKEFWLNWVLEKASMKWKLQTSFHFLRAFRIRRLDFDRVGYLTFDFFFFSWRFKYVGLSSKHMIKMLGMVQFVNQSC
jgi:hypothetical protein